MDIAWESWQAHPGPPFGLFVLIAVVALTIAITRRRARKAAPPPAPSGPEHLLADRLARGEITEEDYVSRVNTLRVNPPGP